MMEHEQALQRSPPIQGTLDRSLEKMHLSARCPFSWYVDLFARSLDRNLTVFVAILTNLGFHNLVCKLEHSRDLLRGC